MNIYQVVLAFMLALLSLSLAKEQEDDDDNIISDIAEPEQKDEERGEKQSQIPIWSCDEMTPGLCSDLKESTGRVATHGGLSIQYWMYAPTKLHKGKSPILVINGGPGLSHDYDLPLRQLACEGRKVIFYDQAGTGASHIPDYTAELEEEYPFLHNSNSKTINTSMLWNIAYLAEVELPALLEDLQLTEYHIVGDSWGTMLALQFAIVSDAPSRHGLRSLTLNGPVPSTADYYDFGWDSETGTIGIMPKYFKKRYKALVGAGNFTSLEFQAMEQILTTDFEYRSGIVSDCFLESMANINEDIYIGIWGHGEFVESTGTIKDFDVYPHLTNNKNGGGGRLSKMPVLITSGEFDMVRPKTVQKLHECLPLSETALFPHSGHITIGDATGELLMTIADFLHRVEASGKHFEPAKKDTDGRNKAQGSTTASLPAFGPSVGIIAVSVAVGVFLGQRMPGIAHHTAQYRTIV